MTDEKDKVTKKIHIKNMTGNCCIRVLKHDFETHQIEVNQIRRGFVEISYNSKDIRIDTIKEILALSGLGIIESREERIVEDVKQAVFELIHQMNNKDSIAKKSEYIVEKLGLNYRYLSKLFSKHEPITLEKFIITHKIERVKNLIDEKEYTLSEIAFMMDYSSVQYLSNQFKKETGISVSEYKQNNKENVNH